MTRGEAPPSPTARMTVRQVVGWGLAFLVIIILIVLFFIYGRRVHPILGALPLEAWQTRLS